MAKRTNTTNTTTDNNATKVKEPETASLRKAGRKETGKTKGEAKAVKAAVKVKGKTIGARAIELLKSGKGSKETLETIRAEFPGCKTQMASIYWYAQHNDIKLQKPAAKKEKAA